MFRLWFLLFSVTTVIRFNLVIYIRLLPCLAPLRLQPSSRKSECVCVNAALFYDGVEKERGESCSDIWMRAQFALMTIE